MTDRAQTVVVVPQVSQELPDLSSLPHRPRVRGLGLPPPTEMIPIPSQLLLSSEEVLRHSKKEQRALDWRLHLARTSVTEAAAWIESQMWVPFLRWVNHQGERLLIKLSRFRKRSPAMGWSDEKTEATR